MIDNRLLWAVVPIVAFMIVPILVVVVFAFTSSPSVRFPIDSWTLHWFYALFDTPGFRSALINSLKISVSVSVACAIIGTAAAYGLNGLRGRFSSISTVLLTMPLVMPPLVLGIIYLSYFSSLGMPLSIATTIIAQIATFQPIAVLIVASRLANFDWTVIDSARDLGASNWRIFADVLFPLTRQAIFGAALVVMALSLDDFLITFFTIGGDNTLPTLLWGMLRKGIDPRMNACAVLLISFTLILGGSAYLIMTRRAVAQ